ncbi:MAG: diguanylate cyclase, partial [Chloroflexota bacterium]
DVPREFAHLGSVLNEMMSAIEVRTGDLREANRKLRSQNKELADVRIQAATDPLTGLGNHRSFHKTLRDEAAFAASQGAPLGLIIIDLDGFKEVNDSLGHLAGDQLLREVAVALTRVVDRDRTYRYGGDELSVILPGDDQATTVETAERLKGAILGVSAPGHGITASFGVACFPESASTSEELVYRADTAMYWAKSAGKNRVSSWSDVAGSVGASARQANERRRPSDVVTSLCMVLAAKDASWRERAERCAAYAGELARTLGLSDTDATAVRLAALTHDVGVLATPDEVLQKPGPLTEAEMALVKRHPVDGANMLTHTTAAGLAEAAVRHHHERFDGSGYPDGLSAETIPIAARIVAVVDAYVAMTSDRPYRVAMQPEAARDELRRGRGAQFDPRVVDAFLQVLSLPDDCTAPAATPLSSHAA